MPSSFRKGCSPFNGESNPHHGWNMLQRSLMYEDMLGKIMSGVEIVPTALEESRSSDEQNTRAFYADASRFGG